MKVPNATFKLKITAMSKNVKIIVNDKEIESNNFPAPFKDYVHIFLVNSNIIKVDIKIEDEKKVSRRI